MVARDLSISVAPLLGSSEVVGIWFRNSKCKDGCRQTSGSILF